jgi:hypothetical protein
VAKVFFHHLELLHAFLYGHIAVIEELRRKQTIKCMQSMLDKAQGECTHFTKINFYICPNDEMMQQIHFS